MNKIIDFVAVRTALFLLLVIWTVYFLKDVLYAVILSAILFTAVCFVLEKLKNRKNSKAYSMDKLDRQCALLGNKYVIQLYRDVTSPAAEIKGDRYFIEGNEMVYSAYKFSSCGLEDVSAAYRTAKENAVTRITMLVKDADRQAVMLAQSTGLNYTFIKSRKLYKKLKDMKCLPPLVFSRPKEFRRHHIQQSKPQILPHYGIHAVANVFLRAAERLLPYHRHNIFSAGADNGYQKITQSSSTCFIPFLSLNL